MKYKIQLKLKSSNLESLVLYQFFLKRIFNSINIKFTFFNLPSKKRKITLNKSPHVNKTAREQFQLITYKCIFQLHNFTTELSLKKIFLNKPKTTILKISKIN
jgi:ribosomal protein S10